MGLIERLCGMCLHNILCHKNGRGKSADEIAFINLCVYTHFITQDFFAAAVSPMKTQVTAVDSCPSNSSGNTSGKGLDR